MQGSSLSTMTGHAPCRRACLAGGSITWGGLVQDNGEWQRHGSGELIDEGARCIGEAECQAVRQPAACQEAQRSAQRGAHSQCARRPVREAQQLRMASRGRLAIVGMRGRAAKMGRMGGVGHGPIATTWCLPEQKQQDLTSGMPQSQATQQPLSETSILQILEEATSPAAT